MYLRENHLIERKKQKDKLKHANALSPSSYCLRCSPAAGYFNHLIPILHASEYHYNYFILFFCFEKQKSKQLKQNREWRKKEKAKIEIITNQRRGQDMEWVKPPAISKPIISLRVTPDEFYISNISSIWITKFNLHPQINRERTVNTLIWPWSERKKKTALHDFNSIWTIMNNPICPISSQLLIILSLISRMGFGT